MRFFIVLILFGIVSTPVLAKPAGKASFSAAGKGFAIDSEGDAPIDAEISKADGMISGTFTVKMADLKTGIALRDKHLCEALNCGKYPKAIFVLSPFAMKDGEGTFTGSLELAGKKAPFSGKATLRGSQVTAKGTIKLTDHGVTPPNYKDVGAVSNEVEVKIDVAL
jgi:polyisoprenoid-binding protein YceI